MRLHHGPLCQRQAPNAGEILSSQPLSTTAAAGLPDPHMHFHSFIREDDPVGSPPRHWKYCLQGSSLQSFLEKKGYSIDDGALNRLLDIMEYFRNRPNFANARTVRNVLDQVIMNQNLRTEDEDGNSMIIVDDVEDYLMDEGIDLSKPSTGSRKIGLHDRRYAAAV